MSRCRFGLVVLAMVGVLLSGCARAELPVVEREHASSQDVVLAIRLSPQLRDINAGASEGFVLLVDESGHARTLEVGPMDVGQLVWSSAGLHISGPTDEYLLHDAGLTAFPRGSEEVYEWARVLAPDHDGFIAVYNSGFGDDHYLGRVTTGDAEGIESWDVTGMIRSVSQCGDLLVGITDLAETDAVAGRPATYTEALVQLYPEPAEGAAILGAVPLPEGILGTGPAQAPCVDGVTYTLSFARDRPDVQTGHPVLQLWDVSNGEHDVLPLTTRDGSPFDVPEDDVAVPGGVVGDRYYWLASSRGVVMVTDLSDGVTTEAFPIRLASPEMVGPQYAFTESSVFVLDVGQDEGAPLDLSRYDLATGERSRVMSIPGTGAVHDAFNMVIRDMALDPAWVKANE